MNYFKMILRHKIGFKVNYNLKNHGFVPGTLILSNGHILSIAINEITLKRISYKQKLIAVINNIKIAVMLNQYQIDNNTQKLWHLKYKQLQQILILELVPIVFIKNNKSNKLNSSLNKPVLKLIIISNSSLIPNYIKVELSGFMINDVVLFKNLNFNGIIVSAVSKSKLLTTLL